MNCPLCLDTTLDVTFHSGIELDICPRCQGVWLDRGELQRLASDAARPARSRTADASPDAVTRPGEKAERREKMEAWETKGSSGKKSSKKKRKKNFAERLGDVFEEIIDL